MSRFQIMLSICLLLATAAVGSGQVDELKITRDGQQRSIHGELVVHSQQNDLLFRATDGRLWFLKNGEFDECVDSDEPFQGLDEDEMEALLLDELPDGFKVHKTKNYLIAYNTSAAYARWVGALYERLYAGFKNYWKTKRFRLHEPDVPLAVIVFDSKENYSRFVQHELGQDPGSMVAYYNLMSNRVVMYDLTGAQTSAGIRNQRSAKQINAMLSSPGAASMVATVVHEATHQIMFNCGMQQRLADTPLWVNEGLAVFFETPDLKSRNGWRSMGKVNGVRLHRFRAMLANRPADSLTTLIADDKRFRDPEESLNAYAEAWALNYYLLKRESKSLVRYLEELAKLEPLQVNSPEERIELFESHFGPLSELDEQLIKFVRRLSVDLP